MGTPASIPADTPRETRIQGASNTGPTQGLTLAPGQQPCATAKQILPQHAPGAPQPTKSGHRQLPFTTIVMPALNEERFIAHAIGSIMPPPGEIECELIVADGGSTDRTCQIVRDLMRKDDRIRLVSNPQRIQAAAMNLAAGIADARAKILVRADCHALYPPGFVTHCVRTLLQTNSASVVVPMRAQGQGRLQKAIAAAQNCRLGNGGAAHRMGGASGYVEHGHHAAFLRDVFEDLGGYDTGFVCNEDAELDRRITASGNRIYLAGDAPITYFPREKLESLAKQYYRYGIGRAQTTVKHRARPRLRQLLPVACLLGCTVAFGLALIDPRALLVPAAYIALCLITGIFVAVREKDPAALASGVAAIVMHMSWASGFLVGLAKSMLAPPQQDARVIGTT